MTQPKNDKKKLAIVGTIIGFFATSVKRRDFSDLIEALQDATPLNPHQLSKGHWKEVLTAAFGSLADKNLRTLAAGVAYYSILALFPGVAAAVAISALLITPDQLDSLVATVEAYLPTDAAVVVTTQLQNLVDQRSDNIFIAIIALAIAVFGASGASRSLIAASNAVYEVKETRGWLAQQFWAIIWTVAGIILGLIVLGLLALNASVLSHFAIPDVLISIMLYGRWLLALVLTVLGLAVFYQYGPNRPKVKWQWVSWGAVLATISWLVATSLFFVYVQNIANYTQSYSLFAGIIVLMVWLNLSAVIALLGAEINFQLRDIGHKKAR